jgi:hypothetical protein
MMTGMVDFDTAFEDVQTLIDCSNHTCRPTSWG